MTLIYYMFGESGLIDVLVSYVPQVFRYPVSNSTNAFSHVRDTTNLTRSSVNSTFFGWLSLIFRGAKQIFVFLQLLRNAISMLCCLNLFFILFVKTGLKLKDFLVTSFSLIRFSVVISFMHFLDCIFSTRHYR